MEGRRSFVLLVFGIVGLPVPDESLLVFCGYLIYKGTLNGFGAWIGGALGAIGGITCSYLIGRTLGLGLIHSRFGKCASYHGKPNKQRCTTGSITWATGRCSSATTSLGCGISRRLLPERPVCVTSSISRSSLIPARASG